MKATILLFFLAIANAVDLNVKRHHNSDLEKIVNQAKKYKRSTDTHSKQIQFAGMMDAARKL